MSRNVELVEDGTDGTTEATLPGEPFRKTRMHWIYCVAVEKAEPVETGWRRVPFQDVVDIRGALMALSQRRLTEQKNQKKVVKLLRDFFDVPFKVYQELHNQIILQYPVPDGWDSESPPIGVLELRQHATNQLLADTIDIRSIPKTEYIGDQDLPKLIKGELGDQNQFSLGEIIHKLHWLYSGFPEEEKIKDGDDGVDREE